MHRFRQLIADQAWLPPVIIGGLAGLVTLMAILILRQPHDAVVLEFDGESREGLHQVWIDGSVEEPGIYLLSDETTVRDAIESAGGASHDADMTNLNADASVAEYALISVPASSRSESGQSDAINVNTAGVDELDALPGIGPALAGRIVEYRNENGAYMRPEDLADISGISLHMVEEFRHQITVSE